MLQIKSINFVSKTFFLTSAFFLLALNVFGDDSIDIWKKEKQGPKKIENINSEKKDPKINYSQKKENLAQIKINDNDTTDVSQQLFGLYDPETNDLSLSMWNNTNGEIIKDTINRINKIQLSSFSEKIFIDTIFTYSYEPKNNLDSSEFLNLKLDWLIKNQKNELIEDFLNTNLDFPGKSKLIKYLIDFYIASADIKKSCEKVSYINQEIKDNYLDKFRIYCLILNKQNENAQLNFDLLREERRSDKFFNDKISFLLGIDEKPNNKISDKNLLYFYLSSVTVENFKYEPSQKTDKNIWKYLNASNLISTDQLEDPETINKYEIAANEGTFDRNKIFDIYMSISFNINQLINANSVYQSLSGYEARALIYQKILLTDDAENKLPLLFLLQDLFKKDNLENIYKEYLSNSLKIIEENDIPNEYKKIVSRSIILEKNNDIGKIKYDDKILHRSRVLKNFTEESLNTDKVSKDFNSIYKKISRNKKYFYSIKDIILLESLSTDGIKMPKDFKIDDLSKNLTIPQNLKQLVDNEEIGLLMLKLVEILGNDDVQNLDPETLYFVVNLLNKAKIKKVRNQILNLTLPLRA